MNAQFISFWSGSYPQFAPAYADELAAITGSMSVTETGSDTFAASGTVLIQGTMSVTEVGDDVFAATGVVTDTAPITAAEVARIVSATARMRTVKYEVARS